VKNALGLREASRSSSDFRLSLESMPPSRKELILAAAVTLMLPIAVELGLRIAGLSIEPQLYAGDPQLGWSLRPDARGTVAGETRQCVHINSHGFRDIERGYDKPANTFRIAVLGNSWTEALQVPLDKTYCSMLEHKLAEQSCFPGKQIEALNLGVSGYSTAQELLLLREQVWKYHPDVVIVAFYSARDIANNMRQFNNAVDPGQSPYFIYRGQSLILDASFRTLPALQKRQIVMQNLRGFVTDHVLVLQAVNALVRYVRTQVGMAEVRERVQRSGGDSLEHSIYKEPSSPPLKEAWRVTEGLLLAIRDETKVHGAQFRIVTLANRPQVIPDPAKRSEFMQELGVSDLSYADERIKALGAREGIPVTTLAPALAEYAEKHSVYLNGFNAANLGSGHWNEIGHRLAGEVIAASMCRSSGVVASPSLVAAH